MVATKDWGPCCCGCGRNICHGDEFRIVAGEFFLADHVPHTGASRAQEPDRPAALDTPGQEPDRFTDLPLFAPPT